MKISIKKSTLFLKKMITLFLLAFVLISIGYLLGKKSVNNSSTNQIAENSNASQVAVYYMHSSFRCSTCNKIESQSHSLLTNKYKQELENKDILWDQIDFQENILLAEKFGIVASCIVVALIQNEEVIEFKRVDEVWTLISDTDAFNNFLITIIDQFLIKLEENK